MIDGFRGFSFIAILVVLVVVVTLSVKNVRHICSTVVVDVIVDVVVAVLVDGSLGSLVGVTVLAARPAGLAARGRITVAAYVPLWIRRQKCLKEKNQNCENLVSLKVCDTVVVPDILDLDPQQSILFSIL